MMLYSDFPVSILSTKPNAGRSDAETWIGCFRSSVANSTCTKQRIASKARSACRSNASPQGVPQIAQEPLVHHVGKPLIWKLYNKAVSL